MSAFLHSCFFFHTHKGTHNTHVRTHVQVHTQSLPLDQNSPGNLWMHQSMPRFWAVHSKLPLAAVKSQCLSEVECNQNRVSSCFIQRHLLWAVFWFTAALHSARSVQRGHKHPAVCTKESQPAALGLFDTSLQATSKEERPRVRLLPDLLLGIGIQKQKQPCIVFMESTQRVQMRFIGVH